MTKMSWKRILQRASNDLPHYGRPFAETPGVRLRASGLQSQRRVSGSDTAAGELETKLRLALARTLDAPTLEAAQPRRDQMDLAADQIYSLPAIPVTDYSRTLERPRDAMSIVRNVLAVTLAAMVFGIAVHQIGSYWGGFDGDEATGAEPQLLRTASAAAPDVIKIETKAVETGYAIQPVSQPGNGTETANASRDVQLAAADEKVALADDPGARAAEIFQRDMEDAVKLFESRQPGAPAATVSVAPPAIVPALPTPGARVAALPPASSSSSAKVAVAAPAPSSPPAGLARNTEDQLFQRAVSLMKGGNVTGARLLFEHLAQGGSAVGAFALAQSYDAGYLQRMNVRGMTPDQKRADYWYRRAAELSVAPR
jgi:hypothetical protein